MVVAGVVKVPDENDEVAIDVLDWETDGVNVPETVIDGLVVVVSSELVVLDDFGLLVVVP